MITNGHEWQGNILIVYCHLQPNARKNEFGEIHAERLKIKINAPAVDGKANQQLIKFLAQSFKVSRKAITLLSGEFNKYKKIAIIDPAEIPPALSFMANSENKPISQQ